MRVQSILNQHNNITMLSIKKSDTADKSDLNTDFSEQILLQKNNHKGMIITAATLTLVGGALLLSKGTQKNAALFLNKIKEYLNNKLELSSLKDNGKWTKFYEKAIRGTNSFIKKAESINNITSLKDILFMKLMYKTKPTKKLHDSISNYFEKLSRKTVVKSYEKTKIDFAKMNQCFDELDKYILKNCADEKIEHNSKVYTAKELIEEARVLREEAKVLFDNYVSKNAMEYRYKYISEVTSSLYSSFWDASFKNFWSKDNKFKRKEMWQTFIAAEQIKDSKAFMSIGINELRKVISYADSDKSKFLEECIKNLDNMIPAKDNYGIEIMKKLQWYTYHPDALKTNKNPFLKELDKLEKHKIPFSDNNLIQMQEDCKNEYINNIRTLVMYDEKGAFQNMLDIYYKIAPLELDKSGALNSLKKAAKSFEKSINLECVEFFDKLRDLKLGSAPTDILTILFSFITLSLGLGYAKDNDKRTSIMLKSGIPIVGGIATTMLFTTKLVSGGKSLAFGLLSAFLLNRLGAVADNLRKKNNVNKTEKAAPNS